MVEGILYSTFQVTCVAQSLLENDCKWAECFEEASLFASKKSLGALFTTLLIYRRITDIVII